MGHVRKARGAAAVRAALSGIREGARGAARLAHPLLLQRRHRREGSARAGLAGAIELIAADGGGVVESTPEIVDGQVAHGRFLFQASVALFEEHGFERRRQLGKWALLVRRTVPAAPQG